MRLVVVLALVIANVLVVAGILCHSGKKTGSYLTTTVKECPRGACYSIRYASGRWEGGWDDVGCPSWSLRARVMAAASFKCCDTNLCNTWLA
ncbi:hypothetical protein AAVH_05343 [Aphelenchoides avenae]|nr:hypothetical protein AAVH_05343 [Aphelenchus avenae]